jgi:hypothetical protein
MQKMNSLKLAIIAITLIVGISLISHAETSAIQNSRNDISHFVRFETGSTQLSNGDRIVIDEVHGTADTIAAGNLYEIKGTYTLSSHSKASLSAFVTSNDPRHIPTMNTQSQVVEKGDGHFTVYLYMWDQGNPHLSFYPAEGGSSFASVYFGTGDSVLKKAQ